MKKRIENKERISEDSENSGIETSSQTISKRTRGSKRAVENATPNDKTAKKINDGNKKSEFIPVVSEISEQAIARISIDKNFVLRNGERMSTEKQKRSSAITPARTAWVC